MPPVLRWLYLNFRCRARPLPNDRTELEKLANGLQISLAFTYKADGLDTTLAQQRIRETLNSFRWIAPLAIAGLCLALVVYAFLFSLLFFFLAEIRAG